MRLWRTVGRAVEVRDDGGPWTRPTLDTSAPGVSARLARTDTWRSTARAIAQRYNVPLWWVLGFVFVESGGDERAVGADGERGLGQIMPSTAKTLGRDSDRLFDGAYNIETMCDLLAGFRVDHFDLVSSASGYNGGLGTDGRPHISMKSPWGLRETPGYIDKIVSAANFFSSAQSRSASPIALGLVVLSGTILYFFNQRGAKTRRPRRTEK